MRIFTRRMLAASVCVLGSAAFAAPTVASATPSPAQPAGHIGGVIPARNAGSQHSSTNSPLTYHGGPVMQGGNNVYLIYWVPTSYSVDPNYESLVSRFFTDVAAASGSTGNVYSVDTQYYDAQNAKIQYNSVLASSYVDPDKLPANGCRDSYTKVCLSDSQIQSEIEKVISTQGWPTVTNGGTNMYFMLTAKGIGSCSSRSSCAFSQYCAYHGETTAGSLIYANMPYADTVPAACDAGVSPNNDTAADAEISVLSHEHNEAITDEKLNAWYDSQGYEIGDKCAWNFGTPLGGSGTTAYNQVIAGDHYYVQQEWSNANSGCVLGMPAA